MVLKAAGTDPPPGHPRHLRRGLHCEHPDHPVPFLCLGLGQVIGGLERTLLILVFANRISMLTSLSLSAAAMNLRVKRGGDYYLISRTLGHGFGGAIGLVLFLAQAISIGFYCIGFAEVMAYMLPAPLGDHPHVIAAVVAGLLFVFAWLGADRATRSQYLVMAILVTALASFFAAGLMRWDSTLRCRTGRRPARRRVSGYCARCSFRLRRASPRESVCPGTSRIRAAASHWVRCSRWLCRFWSGRPPPWCLRGTCAAGSGA